MTNIVTNKSFFTLLMLSIFGFFSLAATQHIDDVAMLAWGEISASSKSITSVKIADFEKNIAAPLIFKFNKKEAAGVSAHISIFPMNAGIDPVQVDLVAGELSPDARTILKENAKWGTKIFIENAEFSLKGKVKIMPTMVIKLN
jgi:hypothetical protein